ncbi:hypothetical protein CEP51_015355 [Fusarium floridanum]|uniref:Pentacotripeptide-repeat region of PRORP domain-containing protein n=1 Tax=Fusarium floridanum TaxID=1325733 RepID=A0A428PBQ7_9HYPO|nr:hypothetical protein CEP51_015355 [Fusarium floridanum]
MLSYGACLRRTLHVIPSRRPALQSATLLQTRPLRQTIRVLSVEVTTTPSKIPSGTDVLKAEIDPAVKEEKKEDGVSEEKTKERMNRNVMKELQYLQDPYKIAERVLAALEKDKFEEALFMTQKASKDYPVVVSWNHLIDYTLRKQQLRKAIKLYNEMKKRAQEPNARTYTVIFRGLAESEHPKLAVAEAVRIYNRLLTDQRITPNSFHLNAVINVCNRAGDLDSMFSVLNSIHDVHRPPTAYTYTTVINALRYNAGTGVRNLTDTQKKADIAVAIRRGKAVWEEVMERWQKGLLKIDEPLVCAMMRLLMLSSTREEKMEVFDLLEKTMGIPNLTKKDDGSASGTSDKDSTGKKTPWVATKGSRATPGRNTLSGVLAVLGKARLNTVGIKYWNLLVRDHQIAPDKDCWTRLFVMLKGAKASAHCTEVLAIIPDDCIDAQFFRMAMETCIADNINLNAIKHSTRALETMMKRLPVPDPHTLRLYLRVSQASHYHLRNRSNEGDVEGAKRDYGMQIAQALERLWNPYRQLHDHYFTAAKAETKKDQGILYNEQREVIALARIMYGSYNKIIQQEMLPEAELKEIRPLGGRINREIHAFFQDRELHEPKLRQLGRKSAEDDMTGYQSPYEIGVHWDTTVAGKPLELEKEPGLRRGFERRRDEGRRSYRSKDEHRRRGPPDNGARRRDPPDNDARRRGSSIEW